MTERELVFGILTGCLLIGFGFSSGWIRAVAEGIRNFQDALRSQYGWRQTGADFSGLPDRVPWLAVVGAGLIAISVIGYTAG